MNNFENEIEAYKKLLKTFDWIQMEEIYAGIMSKIDVSKYADPELNWREMKKIREKIEKGLGKEPELEL